MSDETPALSQLGVGGDNVLFPSAAASPILHPWVDPRP